LFFSSAQDTPLFIFGDLDGGAFLEKGLKILLYFFYLLSYMRYNEDTPTSIYGD
jgi:hypothetical protein